MVVHRAIGTLLFAGLLALGGCSSEQQTGPPDLHIDEDICDLCGMIISEEKFSAAIVSITEGERKPILFDDIGDMLVHIDDLPAGATIESYVHDFGTSAWVVATDAWYTESESLSTPMASGLAAFSTKAEAEAHLQAFPGEVFDWNGLLTQ